MENIVQNNEQLEKLAAVETVEELNKFMAENGLTLEEGVTAEQFLAAMKGEASDELDENDLDAVAGGIVITWAMVMAAGALGIAVGTYIRRYILKR